MDFFTSDQRYLESRILEAGDVILLASGGHGFEVLEEVEMVEVKQGPVRRRPGQDALLCQAASAAQLWSQRS